jgi:6-pyruvoyltetrahydropterin/6-carboxytetrahydropterin synthase
MYEISKQIRFCYGHRLLKHPGKCRHLHGHNAVAEIRLAQKRLDRRSMVADFDEVKEALGGWIDRNFDHRMILNRRDPLLPALKRLNEPVFLTDEDPTAEVLARLLYEEARSRRLPVKAVTVWETPTSSASYGA